MQIYRVTEEKHVVLTKILSKLTGFSVFCAIFFMNFLSSSVFAQETGSYDEISVFLNIPRIGGTEMDALIVGDKIYLPVTDLFNFLKIRNLPDTDLKSVKGFFINQQATYEIDKTNHKIIYQEKTYNLKPEDIIATENNMYLLSTYYGEIFGLGCTFDFRSLSVLIDTKLELPLIKEMKQEEMRKNLKRLKGEIKADTTIGRTYPGFKFGMADWSVNSSEEIHGKSSTQLNLALGAMVAGGEATTSLYYNSSYGFNWKSQNYLWRYVNNDFAPLKQISVGKINTNAISTLFNPVVGIQLTNTPTTYRRSFGTYTLSDNTDPGWIVELYVNNVLVDYTTADASGFFTFQVPLVYGNTIVKLKFIGPWGEEKTKEQNFNIPFTFLPVNTFEYTVNAGFVQDTLNSRFSRASVNYGLTKNVTLGGGAEYLSSLKNQPFMPFLNTSLKITNNLLLTSEYTYGVRSKNTLSYRLPSNMQLDVNYTWYQKGQTAINYNYKEERKATLSIPLHFGKLSTFQRFSLNQIVMPASKYTTGEWLFSGNVLNVNTNLTTYALFVSNTSPTLYSNLSLSFLIPAGIVCMPQVQYGYTQHKLLTAHIELQKHIFSKAYLSVSYEHNPASKTNMAQMQFRYDFSFAQAGFLASRANKKTTLSQYARGSIINDKKTKYIGTDNRSNVGKGGISIVAFIDMNNNGKKDPGEPKISTLNVHANGGIIRKDDRDSTIRIVGLEPYTSCFVELDPNSFENLSWHLPYKTINVMVDPDILKYIEIPVTVQGEASGNVKIIKEGEEKGQGRVVVSFYSANNRLVGKTLTEDNGYFSYLGFTPGKFTVKLDSAQLRKLDMVSLPESIQFTIKAGIDGDVVENLNFELRSKTQIMPEGKEKTPVQKSYIRKDTTHIIIHEVSRELVTVAEDNYAIQVGAFKVKSNAERLQKTLKNATGRDVTIVMEDGFYKVRISDIKDRTQADSVIEKLKENGITELWLISMKGKKQKYITSNKVDSLTKVTEVRVKTFENEADSATFIQAITFAIRSNAIAFRDQLARSLNRKVDIVYENGLYRIVVNPSQVQNKSLLDLMNILNPVKNLTIDKTWVKPEKHFVKEIKPVSVPKEETPLVRPSIVPPEKLKNMKVPLSGNKAGIGNLVVNNTVPPVAKPEPLYSLHVGEFHSHSDALRARKKISAKLKLEVEITKVWDSYHLIIPGFFKKEDTYKYYPELAGMGYSSPYIIENR